jgi:hypothetical protein
MFHLGLDHTETIEKVDLIFDAKGFQKALAVVHFIFFFFKSSHVQDLSDILRRGYS